MDVSVVIPSYNAERYLSECIESVLAQTVKPAEVVVVDDGSKDATAEIAGEYPIELVRHEVNKGLSAGRNTGVEVSGGDVIAFIDSDAVAPSDWLERIVVCYGDENVAGAGGGGLEVNTDGAANKARCLYMQGDVVDDVREVPYLPGLCSSYRRKCLTEAGLFDTYFRTNAEDVDIGFRLRKLGYRLVLAPGVFVYHKREDNVASLKRAAYNSIYFASIAYFKNDYRSPLSHAALALPALPYMTVDRVFKAVKKGYYSTIPLAPVLSAAEAYAKLKASWDWSFGGVRKT